MNFTTLKTFPSSELFLCVVALAVGVLGGSEAHAQPATGGWTNRYNGPGNGDDHATAIAADTSGNVFVTGCAPDAVRLNTDYTTIKYSNAGVPLWTNRYNGPGNDFDVAHAVAVDGSGNVFVTGYSLNGSWPDFNDYVTIKYSGAGMVLWTIRYGCDYNDYAQAIAVDGSGNVVVTGYSESGTGWDYATIKYSGDGLPLWTNRYDGPGNGDDYASAVAVDSSGNVIVTGRSYGSGSGYDYVTIKYSGDGVPLWTNRYNGIGSGGDDHAAAIAVDSSGNVFVTGNSTGTNGYYDYATIAYSSAGTPLWTNRYDGPLHGDDHASRVAVDGSANVVVTGSSAAWGTGYDYVTIKYSSVGEPLWTNRYNGPGNKSDYARAVAMDGSGNVFVTGSSLGSSNSDYATVAYSSAGVPLWTNRYNGSANATDEAKDVAVDGSGNVFVTGNSWNGASYDYVTIKYPAAGGPLLSIARTATNTMTLSWPSPAVDFVLQQNTNVVSTNWTAVGTTPADDGTNKTVIVDPQDGKRFYRLIRP